MEFIVNPIEDTISGGCFDCGGTYCGCYQSNYCGCQVGHCDFCNPFACGADCGTFCGTNCSQCPPWAFSAGS